MRQASIYTAANVASRAVPFLLLPVLTRYLSPTDYGIVAMFLLTVAMLEPLVSVSLPGALTVVFYDRNVDAAAYLGTGLAVVLGLAGPVLLLLWLLQKPLSEITSVPAPWLLLAVPLILARSVGLSLLALLRVRERALTYGLLENARSAALLVLALVLVIGLGFGWEGRVGAEVAVWVAFSAFSVLYLRRSRGLRFAYVGAYAGNLVRFGVPLIPHTLGAVLMTQTDRLLLTNLVGVDETGLYTVGYQLAFVIEVIAVSFNAAYAPWLFKTLANINEPTRRRLVRYTYAQFAGMVLLAGVVAVAMPRIAETLIGNAFSGADAFIGWFALALLFSGLYYMVANYIFYAQKTAYLAAVTITVALVNIPMTYLLILANGAVGAAQALAVSFGLSFVLTWALSQRVYPMPWLRWRAMPGVDPDAA